LASISVASPSITLGELGSGFNAAGLETAAGHQHWRGCRRHHQIRQVPLDPPDPIDSRAGIVQLLDHCQENGVGIVLVENAGRFARDLAVQLAGHQLLRERGIELVAADAPTYFTDPSPAAEFVRQILGAVAQFEKAAPVAKLRHSRVAKRAASGRCERRPSVPALVVAKARRLARKSPKTHKRRSLRAIAAELAVLGHVGPSGAPYHAASISRMLRPEPSSA
jgi:hypothetical protein